MSGSLLPSRRGRKAKKDDRLTFSVSRRGPLPWWERDMPLTWQLDTYAVRRSTRDPQNSPSMSTYTIQSVSCSRGLIAPKIILYGCRRKEERLEKARGETE